MFKYNKFIKGITKFDIKQAVLDIQESPIVWFEGRAEIGPRALGHRSIIADPRTNLAKDKLNIIKNDNGGALWHLLY